MGVFENGSKNDFYLPFASQTFNSTNWESSCWWLNDSKALYIFLQGLLSSKCSKYFSFRVFRDFKAARIAFFIRKKYLPI